MKYQKILILFIIFLLLSGCLGKRILLDKMNDQVNVFGVKLYSDIDYKKINGVVATEEPCIRGYERSFEDLDVIIGYGFDHKIRRIVTRSPSTSMFGIKPGMNFGDGKIKILQSGFNEYAPPFTFSANGYISTFLLMGTIQYLA